MEIIENQAMKAKTAGVKFFKKTWKLGRLYFTISNCRVKRRDTSGYQRDNATAKRLYRTKLHLYEQTKGTCQICGKPLELKSGAELAELHHILPCSRFNELKTDERNVMILCHACHKEIHCNPYYNIKLMEEKAQELGINLDERYNRGG